MVVDTTGLRLSLWPSSHSSSHWKQRRTAFMSRSSMPFEWPAVREEDLKWVTEAFSKKKEVHVGVFSIPLTLKGVYVLASSLLKWKVQLLSPDTLNTQVGKAEIEQSDIRKWKNIRLDVLGERDKRKMDVHLWRLLVWGFSVITQSPELTGQSLPTRQWGWGLCGRSLVTKETVTLTFLIPSMGPWI